jgi:hypothetical protein
METTTPATPQRASGRPDSRRVLIGSALVLAGLGFLVGQAGWVLFSVTPRHWPIIPLFFGVARIVAPSADGRRNYRGGVWLVSIGLWGLVSEFGLFGLRYGTSWPLLVVAAGVNIVLQSFEDEASSRPVSAAREN